MIVVLSPSRHGSTYLMNVLDNFTLTEVGNEIFDPVGNLYCNDAQKQAIRELGISFDDRGTNITSPELNDWKLKNPYSFIQLLDNNSAAEEFVCKLLFENLPFLQVLNILKTFINYGAKFILVERDPFSAYLSRKRATKMINELGYEYNKVWIRSVTDDIRVDFDQQEFAEFKKRNDTRYKEVIDILRQNSANFMIWEYNSSQSVDYTLSSTERQIFMDLNIKANIKSNRTVWTNKQNSSTLEQQIKNYSSQIDNISMAKSEKYTFKKINNADSFCILPWVHTFVSTTGDYRLCCVSKFKNHPRYRQKILNTSLEEWWNGEEMKSVRRQMIAGERPSQCSTCWDKEDRGLNVSKRLTENQWWQKRLNFSDVQKNTDSDGYWDGIIKSFDLRLGNTCNLKCVMCNPNSSSKWLEDKAILNEYENTHWNPKSLANLKWPEENELWDYLNRNKHHLRCLHFAGGEPLLHKKHMEIIKDLVEGGYAKYVKLKYNTNVTILPNQIIDLWNHFYSVHVTASLDGPQSINDWVRFPSKWQSLLNVLDKLDEEAGKHIDVNINSTQSVYTVEWLPEMYDQLYGRNWNKVGYSRGHFHIAPDLVYTPLHLNIRTLPEHAKEYITEKIQNHLSKVEGQQYHDEVQYMLDYMNSEHWNDQYGKEMISYTRKLEEIRNFKYPGNLYE
jgi:MoaA/NifB/PqqE/SkfB family radical SAM enzyme